MRIPKGVQKQINVDQVRIKLNKDLPGPLLPPLSIKLPTRNQEILTDFLSIEGPSVLAYDPEATLPCGASVWIETHEAVTVADDAEVRELPDYARADC